MSLMSVRLGCNDLAKSTAFYDATFSALGIADARVPMDAPVSLYQLPGGVMFMLGAPRDGQPASHGNGDTFGFSAQDPAAVGAWHAAGLANGGTCEGEPGPREGAGGRHGAYLRDPDGHKLCAFAIG